MQELAHVVVRGVDAELCGLIKQNLLLHQLLANLPLDDADDHRIVSVLRTPAHQLLARHLAHPLLADRISRGEDAVVPVRIDGGKSVRGVGAHAGEAGNQVDHHAYRSGGDDDNKKCLDDAIILLQKTDHGGLEPSTLYAQTNLTRIQCATAVGRRPEVRN
jgi:hypothetical protein